MSQPSELTITYWGVTGTLSAPLRPAEVTEKLVAAIQMLVEKEQVHDLRSGAGLEETIRQRIAETLPFHLRSTYGGNTTCVEVQTPDALLIIDCGSGFRELGVSLEARWRAAGAAARRVCHVLVTHAHMDHTFATPFFTPYYNPQNSFSVWGPRAALDSLIAVLNPLSDLSKLYFPPTFDEMKALRDFCPLEAGATFEVGATRVSTCALNHPGGSLGYRIDSGGKSFVFASDHEHAEGVDEALVDFARGADLLYAEGQYTLDEYAGKTGVAGDPAFPRKGWGHSPIEACVRTAVHAGVRALHVGHRDPRRNDQDLANLDACVERLMREELRGAGLPEESCRGLIPFEGMQVSI
jgi:phosphoribosyl 1,2-cyclic phosphodiesterase